MADNNVFVLFEEIKTALKGINNKLEDLPKVLGQVPQSETNTQDLSPIKDAVTETAKAQSEDIKGLMVKQWKAYAQLSTVILQHLVFNSDPIIQPHPNSHAIFFGIYTVYWPCSMQCQYIGIIAQIESTKII